MTSQQSAGKRFGTDIQLASNITLRLMRGENGSIFSSIQSRFDVQIAEAHNGQGGPERTIRVTGSKNDVSIAEDFLKDLSHEASIIIADKGIENRDQVDKRAWDKLNKYFRSAIPKYASRRGEEKRIERAVNRASDRAANEAAAKVAELLTAAFERGKGTGEEKAPRKLDPRTGELKLKKGGRIPVQEFVPRNQAQAIAYLAYKDSETRLFHIFGDAGGGKSTVAMQAAIEAYNDGEIEGIYFFRAKKTTSGADPGAYRGDPKQKAAPYMKAFAKPYSSITGGRDIAELDKHGIAEFGSPDHEKGETYEAGHMIIDEAQDLNPTEARILATRFSEGTKVTFVGDISKNQNSLGSQVSGAVELIARLGHDALQEETLSRICAFICFSAEDSAARDQALPLVNHALNRPELEGYHAIPDRFLRTDEADYMDQVRENTAFAKRMLQENYEVTFERYKTEAIARWPHLFAADLGANISFLQPGGGAAG